MVAAVDLIPILEVFGNRRVLTIACRILDEELDVLKSISANGNAADVTGPDSHAARPPPFSLEAVDLEAPRIHLS